MDAAYDIYIKEKDFEDFQSHAFELQTIATQNLKPEKVHEYMQIINSQSGRRFFYYVFHIQCQKYLFTDLNLPYQNSKHFSHPMSKIIKSKQIYRLVTYTPFGPYVTNH